MPSSRAVFELNNQKSGVNTHLQFCQLPKNLETGRVWVRILTRKCAVCQCHGLMNNLHLHTAHFLSFLKIDKAAGAYSLQIFYYLCQIQHETKAFQLIVRHNTEGPPISDWQ